MMEKLTFTIEDYPESFKALVDALDTVLFDATIHYLDPDHGCPSDKMVDDVVTVRYRLEDMRKFLAQR